MGEAAIVSLVVLLGWLILIWQSGTLRNISSSRKMAFAAIWIAIFGVIALVFRSIG